jgi:hypothetical protein
MSLLLTTEPIAAQPHKQLWNLNVAYANLAPLMFNDQWFVTTEGYHLNPRTEEYTPRLCLSIERHLTHSISLELSILYGLPPAHLGVIDQFSASDRTFEGTERFHFIALSLSSNIYLLRGHFGGFYLSPTAGYGLLTEKTVIPTFGPAVT